MKKIKIRVWDKKDKYYILGEYLGMVIEDSLLLEDSERGGTATIDTVDDLIIEEFTGIYDCNYNEIYEGDVVQWKGREVQNGKQIYPVRIRLVTNHPRVIFALHNISDPVLKNEVTIIGNVNENPELTENAGELNDA